MRIIDIERYSEAVRKMTCGESRFGEISAEWFEMRAFDIKAPQGFTAPEKYPACCEYHTNLVNTMRETYHKFPNCCIAHKKLLNTTWFKKNDYEYVVDKVGNQLMYTIYIVGQRISNDDWFEDITDYISYSYSSFGQFPTGYGPALGLNQYITGLTNEIEALDITEANAFKKRRILEFIKRLTSNKSKEKIDLNVLETTYNNWLKVFPFNISYFKELKKYFEKHFPIVKGPSKTNRYSGITSIKLLTQSDFVSFLNSLTRTLLDKVESHILVSEGVISDLKKHSVELLSSNHRINQATTLSKFSEGELEYVEVLRHWLANEKSYFTELTGVITLEDAGTQRLPVNVHFPQIQDEVQFEDLVCDLYNAEFPGGVYQKFGKKGSTQKGIDIISISHRVAIQCKKKDLSRGIIIKELKADMEADVAKAKLLDINIDRLIFVSTFSDNTELIEWGAKLKSQLKANFEILYLGWESLSGILRKHNNLILRYYGDAWGLTIKKETPRHFVPKTYLFNIPPIVYKAIAEARKFWDTGITAEMLEGHHYLSEKLFLVLRDLAATAFQKSYFEGMSVEEFFQQRISRLMDAAYAAQPRTPGTMHIVIAAGQRSEIIKEYILEIVSGALFGDDYLEWLQLWNRANLCDENDEQFDL
jgi:hypothetical protein